ncbi:interleukin-17 receptor E-like protein [Narcine bancroftii]|uniref:interleukin-17 receptor E-like protein n=1 Tax=Narcine bancroftii TaxID=1343680 RepID=UPI0038318EF7
MSSWTSTRLNYLLTLGLLIAGCQAIEYIAKCGLRCSQGLQCKSKNITFSNHYSRCRKQPSSMPSKILEDLNIFTVLKCIKEKQCSMFLNVKGTLTLNEHIRGVEICSASVDTLQCLTVKFNKYQKFITQPVLIEYNCFKTSIAEYNSVMIKTIPHYCDVLLMQEHRGEDCTDKDVGQNIPSCRVGKLDYDIDKSTKRLSVRVYDFLENYAYHVRLCLKWFVCEDLGTSSLIAIGDPKNVTLPYSQLLPCLCIEGWSALPDARRSQLCPFTNYTEELWNGLTYNHNLQELSWKSSCPIDVDVNLCWMSESNEDCTDLQDSFHKGQHKVTYSRIEPHPKLCVKFTSDKGFWVRCPFASGYLPAWNMSTAGQLDNLQLTFVTQGKAEFKTALCNRTGPNKCEPIKELIITARTMGVYSAVFNFPSEQCDSDICVQGWRTDIEYSVRIQICDMICKENFTRASPQFLWPMAITAILLIMVTLVIITGYILFTAPQKPYRKVFLHSSQFSTSMDAEVKGISRF